MQANLIANKIENYRHALQIYGSQGTPSLQLSAFQCNKFLQQKRAIANSLCNRPPWSFTAILYRIWNFRNYAAADMSIDNPKASATPNA